MKSGQVKEWRRRCAEDNAHTLLDDILEELGTTQRAVRLLRRVCRGQGVRLKSSKPRKLQLLKSDPSGRVLGLASTASRILHHDSSPTLAPGRAIRRTRGGHRCAPNTLLAYA